MKDINSQIFRKSGCFWHDLYFLVTGIFALKLAKV